MNEKVLLKDKAAKIFLNAATNNCTKFTKFGTSFFNIGGYYKELNLPLYVAYNFSDNDNIFIERFIEKKEAIRFAKSVIKILNKIET